VDHRPAALAETHVSVVVFVGDRAYKLKKPVTTPFLDYGTREQREAVCHLEVELNRRLAPDVYLGVADVTGPDGQLCDHLVVMRRMPDDLRLSTMVTHGRATPDHVAAVARRIAAFHATAHRSVTIDAAGSLEAVRRLWVDNFAEMTGFAGPLLHPETLGAVEGLALRYLDGRGPLYQRRVADGRIVDGHGDLLADDIFCLDDGPRILDCLEFDERLRFGDVLLDVGFLAMDLERLGSPALARHLLDAYREFAAETHPSSLEHHYIAYRALVRSKIACLRAEQGDATAAPAAASLLDLCARHLYHGRVRLVVVGGLPGTGKTTVAEGVARRLGCTVLRSDHVRKELAGIPATTRAVAPYGEGIYDTTTTAAVYTELLRRAGVALGLGESVVLDASFVGAEHREAAAAVARSGAAELSELRCDTPPDVAAARVARRLAAGRDASDATPAIAAAMADAADPWPGAGRVDTSGEAEAAVEAAVRLLGGPLAAAAG
jgi:aminoglycoside phosphotransferase family enzyme/predicted kinase